MITIFHTMKNLYTTPIAVFCAGISSLTTVTAQDALPRDINEILDDELYAASMREKAIQEEKGGVGFEALTSWRSEYVYRGFSLASSSMEFQLAAQIALSDTDSIDAGIYYGSETGRGSFSELTGFLDYSRVLGKFTYSGKLAYREYGESFFKSGMDLGLSVGYQINEAFDVTGKVSYDSGADGFYVESKVSYYEEVNSDSYFVWDVGISAVGDYYDRDGIHHAFSKMAYTYNINDTVSVSPYVSGVLGIHEDVKNHLFGGVYFAVNF